MGGPHIPCLNRSPLLLQWALLALSLGCTKGWWLFPGKVSCEGFGSTVEGYEAFQSLCSPLPWKEGSP